MTKTVLEINTEFGLTKPENPKVVEYLDQTPEDMVDDLLAKIRTLVADNPNIKTFFDHKRNLNPAIKTYPTNSELAIVLESLSYLVANYRLCYTTITPLWLQIRDNVEPGMVWYVRSNLKTRRYHG